MPSRELLVVEMSSSWFPVPIPGNRGTNLELVLGNRSEPLGTPEKNQKNSASLRLRCCRYCRPGLPDSLYSACLTQSSSTVRYRG